MITRTRFAPSPTGFMHVGGARTALFAWLIARQGNGQFILRIEDTDRLRHVEESEQHILDTLDWLGLHPDEGPIRQSQRLEIYKNWAQKLVGAGRAYADPYSKQELEDFRAQAEKDKKPFLFRNHRPENPPQWDGSQPLRFKSMPKKYEWQDAVMGGLKSGEEVIDDFIILKSDGFPTYNFAHIIDDHEMRISHVIRTQEFLPSVPKYLNLYEALEIERPTLATLPYVMAPGGKKKLSKRDGAKDILDYKKLGYLPEALINFLASLGWNDGSLQELYSAKELITKFDLEHVQHGGAMFDEQRLIWMNGHYIRGLQLEDLANRAEEFWPKEAKSAAEEYKREVLATVQERLKYLSELPDLSIFFFKEPTEKQIDALLSSPPDKMLKDLDKQTMAGYLQKVQLSLEKSDFSQEDIADQLNGLLSELDTKPGILFALIRIAVSGSVSTPELFGMLSVLGKERSLKRINNATDMLNKVF